MKISEHPCLPEQEMRALSNRLGDIRVYLEYGAGGSTMLAGSTGVPYVYCVDTDQSFLSAVATKFRESYPKCTLTQHYADVGPCKEWGYPANKAESDRFPSYASGIWRKLDLDGRSPDLILIDGRFRVATFLVCLIQAAEGTKILFDDYVDRSSYALVERYAKVKERHGRMMEFQVGHVSMREVVRDLLDVCADPL